MHTELNSLSVLIFCLLIFHLVGECGVRSNRSLCNFAGVESLSNQVRVFLKFSDHKVIHKGSLRVDSEYYKLKETLVTCFCFNSLQLFWP